MTLVYQDSTTVIHFIERHPDYIERIRRTPRQLNDRGHLLCTGIFTFGDVLAGFYKRGQTDAASPHPLPQQPHIGRRDPPRHRAVKAGVNPFIANDRKLSALVVEDIDFIAGPDVNRY